MSCLIKKTLPIGIKSARGFLKKRTEIMFMSTGKNAENAYGQIRNREKYFVQKCAGRKAIRYD